MAKIPDTKPTGQDFYTVSVAEALNVSATEVTPHMRQTAKIFLFSLMYGSAEVTKEKVLDCLRALPKHIWKEPINVESDNSKQLGTGTDN